MRQKSSNHIKTKVCVSALALLLAVTGLTGNSRDRWQQPEKVLEVVGVKPGMVIGEPGAGKGYYTFKLAKKVGPAGKIYANDIEQYLLDDLKEKCKKKKVDNVVTVMGEENDPKFPDGQMDMVFMSYVFHHLDNPVAFMKNLKRSLKPDAPVVILEQDPAKSDDAPGHFLDKKKILRKMERAGYQLVKLETFLKKDTIYIYRAQ
jgi:ubiquinone/menaquinone biosynthesis C-methylase UbiE